MTGRIVSNDGEVAIVQADNGERIRFERTWALGLFRGQPALTRQEFLRELPTGELIDGLEKVRKKDLV
ncbi:MAG: hypothetical protein E6H00_13015 [Bacillati bacterium ANGP1]|uniref:Uncharacterized protein n=1 Tax=Candidatus Segetimicrobium genomatis TaxID=2569760 RepID=A0A537JXT2_9BACT|nr:MAG: hypothetical protein E6H00_13015 [Terrabacteria group bacterium ANGP1]